MVNGKDLVIGNDIYGLGREVVYYFIRGRCVREEVKCSSFFLGSSEVFVKYIV